MTLYGGIMMFHKEIIIMSQPLKVVTAFRLILLVALICLLYRRALQEIQYVPDSFVSFPQSSSASLSQKLLVFRDNHVSSWVCCLWNNVG